MSELSVKDRTFLGHPIGLFVLFFAEMWERFCYYGMRGLLVLFITKALFEGDAKAFAIYGAYTGLVYMAPVLGGWVADKILGYKYAVIFGGILMAIGEFLILGGNLQWLYIGMAVIIVGNGYFKANISSIVGKLYDDQDVRKDSGFTIFYIGINLGALLATLVAVWVGETYGFKYGFALAGVGMLLGLVIFIGGQKYFDYAAMPPNPEDLHKKVFGPLTKLHVTILLSLLLFPLLYLLLQNNSWVGYLLIAVAAYVIFILLKAGFESGKVLTHRMIIFIILCLLNIIFWSLFEQAGSSLTLFADRNVNREGFLGFWDMTAGQTQFFNPFFILVMGTIFTWMWMKLDALKMNPNIPAKFGIGIMLVGVGFLVTILGKEAAQNYLVPMWTIVGLYFFHTVGELFLSPIGLSMVTKLAPPKMTGTLMGAWFLSFAGSNYVAGSVLAPLTGTGGESGEAEVTLTISESLDLYVDVFTQFGYIALVCGGVIVLLSPLLNKLMHGIK
ncbi:peptide MFS transporter [Winogradskyella sp.]|uniref:peptide MFS transporter n=1 Tax=Winogradskyella sp. TaxID=1883156 RepID=UPI00263701B7|nr:peptide MFS transporter [Winogradskyella sp.]